MTYAVLQQNLEIPPVETLKRAFRAVPFLIALDAHTLARDAYGILVRRLTFEDATLVQRALLREGLVTDVVEEKQLPPLPMAKAVNRLDCVPEGLMIYDPLGRSFPLEWGHVLMIAGGNVRLNEFKRVVQRRVVNSDYGGEEEVKIESRVREELHYRLLLEVYVSRAVLRYILQADKFNFQYLGARKTESVLENCRLLVQDLARFAPHALVNRGAFSWRDNAPEPFQYPSRNAFNEELTWLLWRLKQSGRLLGA